MADQKFKVQLLVYDISGGLAKVFSPMLLQKQIDGIWHTGVVVYGKEFYFGGGICSSQPKQTPYGIPVDSIEMGDTEVPEEVFTEFLRDISERFTVEKYCLIKNNCNNFSDECLQFLTGKSLPEYIIGLPEEILSTPMGQMMKPMIDNMQQKIINQSGQAQVFPQAFEGQNNAQQLFPNNNSQNQSQVSSNAQQQNNSSQSNQQNNNQNAQQLANALSQLLLQNQQQQPQQQQQQQQQHLDMKNVKEINDFMEFISETEGSKAVVIDFYADWCGPCRAIKPIFIQYSVEYPKIKFLSINTEKNKDIASQFGVQALPTFVSLHDGQIFTIWKGANQVNLKQNLDKLNEKVQ